MRIESVHIRNFRKLKNCHIDFGEKETVLVGANNSGKTSAISAIVWFLRNTDRFTLKEFTATNWASIIGAFFLCLILLGKSFLTY